MDSFELLRQLAAARPDDPRWALLFERCRVLIRRALALRLQGRRGGGWALLDDLGQEVMERLLLHGRRGLRSFAGERDETFEGYIIRIAENVLLDRFRREAFRLGQESLVPPEELWRIEASAHDAATGSDGDPEAGIHGREFDEIVERTLRQISPNPRQRALNRLVFRLYFMDGCSIPQIARMRAVTLSHSTIARRIRVMRAAFRRAFRQPRARNPGSEAPDPDEP